MGFSGIIELEILQCFQILSFDFYIRGYSFFKKNCVCLWVCVYNHHHKFNTYCVLSIIHIKNLAKRDQTRFSIKVPLICVTRLSIPLGVWSQ